MEIDSEMTKFMDQYLGKMGASLEKVMVFIDAGYWQRCFKDYYPKDKADRRKVINKLVHGRRLLRTYFYTAKIEKPPSPYWKSQQDEQQKFLSALAHEPYIETRLGRLQFGDTGDPPRQKGVDVLLALDMLRFALKGNYETAILVSGDGDFADIVRMVKDEGRKVEIAIFPGTCAFALLQACDEKVEITQDFMNDCWEAKIP